MYVCMYGMHANGAEHTGTIAFAACYSGQVVIFPLKIDVVAAQCEVFPDLTMGQLAQLCADDTFKTSQL